MCGCGKRGSEGLLEPRSPGTKTFLCDYAKALSLIRHRLLSPFCSHEFSSRDPLVFVPAWQALHHAHDPVARGVASESYQHSPNQWDDLLGNTLKKATLCSPLGASRPFPSTIARHSFRLGGRRRRAPWGGRGSRRQLALAQAFQFRDPVLHFLAECFHIRRRVAGGTKRVANLVR